MSALVPDTARLPSQDAIDHARLPVVYEQAKTALSQCERVDECKAWGDKASAIASYARQADDKTLLNHALRIQARAQRRVGELLEHYKMPPGKRGGASRDTPTCTQRTEAAKHGLSKDQEVAAKRAAAIPRTTFEASVESDDPPTKERLSEMGRRAIAAMPHISPGFDEATHTMGALRRFCERTRAYRPPFICGGLRPHEVEDALAMATSAELWLTKFIEELRERQHGKTAAHRNGAGAPQRD